MRILLICFLGMRSLIVLAQQEKDSVRLVDIQSSECGGMYTVKPGFISKKIVGDTTFIQLFCSNNCGGYHSPNVALMGDSVLITIHAGEKLLKPFVHYKVNGEIYSEDDLRVRERKYNKKYSRSDTVIVMDELLMMASCNCCYTFELKVTGLDPSKPYKYFYNEQYIDPEYKPTGIIKEYAFPYFFQQPESEIIEAVQSIVSRQEGLLKELENDHLLIRLTADTVTGRIKSILTDFELFNKNQEINDQLEKYFFSIAPINCIKNPFKPALIQQYWVYFSFSSETNKLEMFYESGESYSDK